MKEKNEPAKIVKVDQTQESEQKTQPAFPSAKTAI